MPNTTTQAIVLKDFSGGLWFNEGEPPNNSYSPYMKNLDPLAGGGVQKRAPLRLDFAKTSLDLSIQAGVYQNLQSDPTNGARYVVADKSGAQYRLTNYTAGNSTANWNANITANTSFAFGSSDAGANWYTLGGTSFQGYRVIASSGAATIMATTFNDNIAAPANGCMPQAYIGCQHLSAYFFLGNTYESATPFVNRIRWSHPGRFEDWRTNDKLTVGDAAPILGLYSVGETLLIVKQTSVWILTGYDPDTFQLRRIVDMPAVAQTGAIAACSNAQQGGFVYVQRQGVFHWDGKKWSDVSGGIKDAIADGRFHAYNMSLVGDTLYVSSQDPTAAVPDATAVSWEYHIPSQRWTLHGAPFTGLAEVSGLTSPSAKGYALHNRGTTATSYAFSYYRQQQAAGSWADNHTGSTTDIVCEWRSPWQDARNPARKKRWRKPWFVFNKRPNASASDPASYTLTIFKDWDGVHSTKSSTFSATKATDTTDYSTNYGYGHATTGTDYDEGGGFSAPGSGYAMQVLVSSTGTPKDQWGFDSVTFKFVPRSLK